MSESVPFVEVLEDSGRGDVTTSFWSSDYVRGDIKHGEREKVAQFILEQAKSFPVDSKTHPVAVLSGD